jgi:hypothetical protein
MIGNTDQTLANIKVMMSQETSAYAVHNYLARVESFSSKRRPRTAMTSATEVSSSPVDATCRYLMAKWCNSLCDFCKYDRDVTASAMSCVDRMVATSEGFEILMDRDRYQLAVMTALYMVAKIQQMEALDPESVAKLSREKYSKQDIEKMELDMLVALRWRVHPPTGWAFAHELLNLIPIDVLDDGKRQRIADLTKFQIELATCNYDLSLNRPSSLAFGAILNAMESIDANIALQFESIVSNILPIEVDQLRCIRVELLKVVSVDSDAEPMSALLTQRMSGSMVTTSSLDKEKLTSSCAISSPRCVSANFP